MLYPIKMVAIAMHMLCICTHQKHDILSVSRYGTHKPIRSHVSFAIKSCYDIAFDEYL